MIMVPIGLAILTLAVYSPALENDFTNWDDPTYVSENPLVLGSFSSSLGQLLTTPVSLNYHPVTMFSLVADRALYGSTPKGFHLTNVIFHVLNTVLVFVLAYLVGRKRLMIGALTAVIFGLHPMHVESVAWISARKDVLYTFFFLGALVTYFRYLETRRSGWIWSTWGLFLLSVLSKAMAVVFPVVLLLVDFLMARKTNRKLFLEKLPFLAVSVIFGIVAFTIQSRGAIGNLGDFSVAQRLLFASYGCVMYVVKFFVPAGLAAFYPYPDTTNLPAVFYAAPLIMVALAALLFVSVRQTRVPIFAFGFYFVTVVLVLQFLSVGQAIMADRYTYLSYVGLGLGAAWGMAWLVDFLESRTFRFVLAGLVLLTASAMAYVTQQRVQIWANSEVLWTDVIEKYPESAAEAYANRGSALGSDGRVQEALRDLEAAVRINDRDARYLDLLGVAYGSNRQFDEAFDAFARGLERDPGRAEIYLNRAVIYSMMRDYARAAQDCRTAIDLNPNSGRAHFTMSRIYQSQNDLQQALSHAQQAQRLGFDVSPEYLNGLANPAP